MKRFIIKTIFFIFIFFILDNLLYQALFRLWRKTDFIYSRVVVQKPDIIFFGDSKTRHGIIPDIIKQETEVANYNIARFGSGVVYSKAVQGIILSHYRPKVFVIQYMHLPLLDDTVYRLAPYLGDKELSRILSFYPYNVRLKIELFKTIRFNSQILTIFYRLLEKYDSTNGYVPLYGVSSMDRTESFVNNRGLLKLKPGVGESVLKEFMAEAKKNNIKVIMLGMPVLGKDEIGSFDTWKNLAKENGIPILDFLQTNQLSLDCFRDSTHLNDRGAREFSFLLGREINKLLKEE